MECVAKLIFWKHVVFTKGSYPNLLVRHLKKDDMLMFIVSENGRDYEIA